VLILVPRDALHASAKVPLPSTASAVDRALRDHFASGDEARSIFSNERLLNAARAHAQSVLERAGLIPDAVLREARQHRFVRALFALAAPAALKMTIALSRGHSNVVLLAVAAGIFGFVAYRIGQRPRTPAGDRALEYLMQTFEPVRRRIKARRDPPIDDLAATAAVFGLAALPTVSYAHTKALMKRNDGGGCGGGCSGGCGGGCGGCGGCGG
jgi:uncharacterized protein (TIGR04222 family)